MIDNNGAPSTQPATAPSAPVAQPSSTGGLDMGTFQNADQSQSSGGGGLDMGTFQESSGSPSLLQTIGNAGKAVLNAKENLDVGGMHGVASTAAGMLEAGSKYTPLGILAAKIAPNAMHDAQQWLQNQSQNTGTDTASKIEQGIGKGGESLTEFLLGDEALKGLSYADKMQHVAKVAKIIEKSPKLSAAIQSGAELAKVQGELSPEEIQLIRQYPRLAKFASIGAEALRHGAVQGAQTFAQTGGDAKEAGKQALEMAGTSGALGATLGAIGGVAGKVGKTAETAQALTDAAKNAPTAEGVRGQVEGFVNEALNPERAKLDSERAKLDSAKRDIAGFAAGTPSKETLAEEAQKYAQTAEQNYHGAYQQGIAGIQGDLAGETIPYENSPLHQAAQELVQHGEDTSKPLDTGFKKTRPGSPALNSRLDFLANPQKEAEAATPETWVDANGVSHTEEAAPTEEQKPINLDINELLSRRKELGEQLRNTGWSTDLERQDRSIYKRLMQGVDDSIQTLAENANSKAQEAISRGETPANPNAANVLDRYKAINNDYRQSKRIFENKDVQAILEGRQNDVAHRLMSGATSLDDINAVKKAFGDQTYNRFATDALQRFAADSVDDQGSVDYNGLLKKWNRMKPDVREAMFGKFPSDTFSNVLNGASGADEKLNSANKTLSNIMANGDTKSIMKSPERLDELESVVGPDAMSQIGQSVLQNQIREASTYLDKTGNVKQQFDPDKFLGWVNSMKDNPEVMDRLFKSTPENSANFEKLLNDVGKVRAQKIRNMIGIGTVAGAPAVAAVGHAAGVGWGLQTLLGEMVGAGAIKPARDLLARMADNPTIWKALSKGKAVESATSNPAVRAAAASRVFGAAKSALGGGSQ